jgi:xanthine/uracil permease
MIGSIMTIPFILTPALCMHYDDPAKSHIICTMIFVTGIVTWVQATFGCRYVSLYKVESKNNKNSPAGIVKGLIKLL